MEAHTDLCADVSLSLQAIDDIHMASSDVDNMNVVSDRGAVSSVEAVAEDAEHRTATDGYLKPFTIILRCVIDDE